jgi:ABC-type amino acid transport substrate-binding protein
MLYSKPQKEKKHFQILPKIMPMKKLQLSPILTLLIILVRISSGQQSVNLRDTIKVASEPDYPPYCIVDKEGNATGFSVDLFKEAAKAAGLNVSIKIGIWDKIKNDLAIGELDALPLVGRTPEREKDYDFTFPYITLHGAIFIRDGFTQIKSVDDLKNISVAVMKGDNAEEYLRRNKVTDKIITTNTFSEAFTKLISGEVNAVVMQRVT